MRVDSGRLTPSAGQAACQAGRAVVHWRLLCRQAHRVGAVFGAGRVARQHLGRIELDGRQRIDAPAVDRARAEDVGAARVDTQAQPRDRGFDLAQRSLRLGDRPRPGVRPHQHHAPAVGVGHRYLQRRWRRRALDAADAHPIAAQVLKRDRGPVHGRVGCQNRGRVEDLVQQLFGGRRAIDHAPGTRRLGQHHAAVAGDFNDRVAHLFQPGHVGPAVVVAAAGLRAAFEQVAGDHARGDAVPVSPAEFMQQRADGERHVGATAGDHDVGAAVECLANRRRAEVGVGAEDAAGHGGKRPAVVQAGERFLAGEGGQHSQQVVAVDHRDLEAVAHARRAQQIGHRARAAMRVEAAGVGDQPGARAVHQWQDVAQHGEHVAGEALGRILVHLRAHDAQGDLGKVVHDQVVDRGAAHQFAWFPDVVTP